MTAGRPPKFKSVEEMQEKIDKYFNEECGWHEVYFADGRPVLDGKGNPMLEYTHPTITGLALALGFTSRRALLDYEGKPKFLHTIKDAKMRVQRYAEQKLYDSKSSRGAEFNLKNNFGWASEQTIKLNDKRTDITEEEVQEALANLGYVKD